MKSKILKIVTAILCIPMIMLCGCSDKPSKLSSIDQTVYFESKASALAYNNSKTKELELKDIISDTADPLNIDSFVEIKLTAKSAWIYKMYIDCITFYVYANKTTDVEMIINTTITNMADEDDIKNPSTFEALPLGIIPQENGSILCKIPVGKTVATATGCTITFDINNSTSGTVADNEGKITDFRWLIYGLEIYGEHRTY